MAQYGLQTEVTTHLKGMQVVDDSQNDVTASFDIDFAVSSTNNAFYQNSDSYGRRIIIINEDLPEKDVTINGVFFVIPKLNMNAPDDASVSSYGAFDVLSFRHNIGDESDLTTFNPNCALVCGMRSILAQ